jgi:hypothetical protein
VREDAVRLRGTSKGEESWDDDFAGGGALNTTLVDVKAGGSGAEGDGGLRIREKGAGNLAATVLGAKANANKTDGMNIREDSSGTLAATVDRSTTNGNDSDGVHFDERGADALTATASAGTSAGNSGVGVRADQGNGTLALTSMTLAGNAEGALLANPSVTVTQTP